MRKSDFLVYFSNRYEEARSKFRDACRKGWAEPESYVNPAKSPQGDVLSTDVAWFGPRNASRVLVVLSGTHGVEGFCGSGCQVGWIASGGPTRMPEGVGVLVVHMLNPYGAAWRQRETEEGVDLNRNFIDHDAGLPQAPLYAEIEEALMCPDLAGPAYEAAEAKIAEFRQRYGDRGFAEALFGGQYQSPEGMCYGGREPAWSRKTLVEILNRHAGKSRHVIQLDYHTGLGPYAYASMIAFCKPEDELFARATAWFGPTVMAVGGIAGPTANGCKNTLGSAQVTPITVEYGTYDLEREFRVVRRAQWLKNYGDPDTELGRQIKAELMEYFYPADDNWKEMVWHRSQQIIRQSLDALASQD